MNDIKRLSGWEDILAERIKGADKKPYEIGVHDCAIFAAETLALISPFDFTLVFKGKYKTRIGSLKFIKKYGKTLEEAVSAIVGIKSISPTLSIRGGIVIIKDDNGMEHIGICLGDRSAFLSENGLIFVRTLDCIATWRI